MGIDEDETLARIGVLRRQAAAERGLAADTAGDHQARAVHALAAQVAGLRADELEAWLRAGDPGVPRPRMVNVLAAVLGTPSVAAVLWFGRDGQWTRLSASDPDGQAAGEAELLTGQGPTTSAWQAGRPCAAPAGQVAARWPLYGHAIAGLDPAAVAAAPLGPAGSPLGAICARYPGATGPEQVTMAAAAVTRLMLHQAGNIGQLLARDTSLAVIHRAAMEPARDERDQPRWTGRDRECTPPQWSPLVTSGTRACWGRSWTPSTYSPQWSPLVTSGTSRRIARSGPRSPGRNGARS